MLDKFKRPRNTKYNELYIVTIIHISSPVLQLRYVSIQLRVLLGKYLLAALPASMQEIQLSTPICLLLSA